VRNVRRQGLDPAILALCHIIRREKSYYVPGMNNMRLLHPLKSPSSSSAAASVSS